MHICLCVCVRACVRVFAHTGLPLYVHLGICEYFEGLDLLIYLNCNMDKKYHQSWNTSNAIFLSGDQGNS